MYDEIRRNLFLAVAKLPPGVTTWLSGRPPVIDGERLDPACHWFGQLAAWMGGPDQPPLSELSRTRADMEVLAPALAGPPDPAVSRRDGRAEASGLSVPIRVYRPVDRQEKLPCLVYYHGGGWVLGSRHTHDGVCRDLARDAECVVVSVDYRLAPEHPFPAAVDDALAAYRWALSRESELDIDHERVAVAGDSAGGNLATVVSRLCRDAGTPPPFLQLLIYPVTDLSCERPSYEKFARGFYLTRERMHWFRDLYLPEATQREDPRASPLLADDLTGLPPAQVVTAGFDVLRDEGSAYAQALEKAGNRVSLANYPSLIHGFMNLARLIAAAGKARDEVVQALRAALHEG